MDDRRDSVSGDIRTARSSLPVQLTTFVGRQAERSEVRCRLGGARLLTLTGPGGVGKTRLALEVAADLAATCPGCVRLVELAALADGALIPQAVAAALGVQEVPGLSLRDTLAAALGSGRRLLILDNCEHLVAACAELVDRLLRACPALRVLATSREPLGVPGETIWPVPPLLVPDPRVALGTDEIAASEAVRLFVDRARLVQPAFALGDRNARVVAEICRRLDGIPLAIELAAARLRSLGLVDIAERLHCCTPSYGLPAPDAGATAERVDDCFRLLTSEARTILPRQQTLRATIDWSYALLEEPERQMLRALTVFAGGFTLDAAEGFGFQESGHGGSTSVRLVHARGMDGRPSSETRSSEPRTLDVLTRLVDRSLVLADSQHGRARYRLLETIRQYGLERLRERGEEAALRARHCDWFLALAEQARPALRGPDQAAWVERLELEHDNLRAALAWGIEAGDAERGLRLAGALWRFWSYRGYLIEGRRWLDAVLALPDAEMTAPALLAEVLFAAGRLTHQQGEYAAAHRRFQAALSIAEQGDYAEGIIGALTQLGHLALNQDQHDAAREQYARALAHRHAVGDCGEVIVALASLAFVSHLQGRYDESRDLYEEGLAIVERLGDRSLGAYLLCRLGELAVDQGRYGEARERFTAGLNIYRMLGARTRLAGVLEGFAVLAAAHDQPTRALRLVGAAAALRDAVMARPTPREAVWLRPGLERARRQLGEGASDRAWAAGLALSLEQAMDEALDEHVGAASPARTGRPANGLAANGASSPLPAASSLIEVDVDTSAYDSGHIPGAVGFNWTTQLSDRIRRDIVDKAAWEQLLGSAGVGQDTRIVYYGDNNNWFAAFAY